MAISIPDAYIETFESNVRQLAQQKRSRLRNCVTEVNNQSEKHNWDRLAASAARLKDAARKVSPAGGNGSGAVDATDGLAWTRRNTVVQTWDTGEVVEPEDIVQMLIDPANASSLPVPSDVGQRTYTAIVSFHDGTGTPPVTRSVTRAREMKNGRHVWDCSPHSREG